MKNFQLSDLLVWLLVPLILVLSAAGGVFILSEWAGEEGIAEKLKRTAIAASCALYRSDTPRIHLVGMRRGRADVHLADAGAPLILVLTSDEIGHWTVTAESGVTLTRIIVSANISQTYDVLIPNVPVTTYFNEIQGRQPIGHTLRTSRDEAARRGEVKELLGAEPDTIQFRLAGGEFLVDCISSSEFRKVKPRKRRIVRLRNLDGTGKVAKDGLTVSHCCDLGYSTFYAPRSQGGGKWYFEVTLSETAGEEGVGPFSTVGVLSDFDLDDGFVDGADFVASMIQAGQMSGVAEGDVVSIAVDLDEWRVYFAINGTWFNGDPDYGEGGEFLEKDKYFAVVASWGNVDGNGDEWVVNLGATAFEQGLPEGYRAFDGSGP